MDHLTIYEKRKTEGIYESIFNYLVKLGPMTLAGAEFGKDFVTNNIDGFHGCTFTNKRENTEFETIIFGEILPEAAGTHINAKGNHFISNPVCLFLIIFKSPFNFIYFLYKAKKITDDIKIKLPIVLGVPTGAPDHLRHLFENQIVTLNDVRQADKIEEEKTHSVCSSI